MPEYKGSQNILSYYSFGSEADTREYFQDKTKNWYLPRIEGEELVICPYSINSSSEFDKQVNYLCQNKYKIFEPVAPCINDISIIDMILVPALCADINGYRIGYGKGYYDRLLKKFNKAYKVILIFNELLNNCVYPENFDEKCDFIVTDKQIIKI